MNDKMNRIKAISNKIKKDYNARQVILFGYYARGEATEDSDVDILVIAPTTERFFQRMATVLRIVRDLRKGIPLSPIVLRPDEIKSRIKI
jgi:predicted nucleotidyltransferase